MNSALSCWPLSSHQSAKTRRPPTSSGSSQASARKAAGLVIAPPSGALSGLSGPPGVSYGHLLAVINCPPCRGSPTMLRPLLPVALALALALAPAPARADEFDHYVNP